MASGTSRRGTRSGACSYSSFPLISSVDKPGVPAPPDVGMLRREARQGQQVKSAAVTTPGTAIWRLVGAAIVVASDRRARRLRIATYHASRAKEFRHHHSVEP